MNTWAPKSAARLATCHPDLQVLANEVLKYHDAVVVFGIRTEEEQNDLFAKGHSKLRWPDSKHNSNPSQAIDLAPYIPGANMWEREYSLYFGGFVLGVADMLFAQGKMTNKVRWGGNWSTKRDRSFRETSFYDGLHFEIV